VGGFLCILNVMKQTFDSRGKLYEDSKVVLSSCSSSTVDTHNRSLVGSSGPVQI